MEMKNSENVLNQMCTVQRTKCSDGRGGGVQKIKVAENGLKHILVL